MRYWNGNQIIAISLNGNEYTGKRKRQKRMNGKGITKELNVLFEA